jgi:uncharacterized protein with ParB-like and HNH nuclease domain
MQAGILTIHKLFGREVHYVVPLYQRPYVWNEHDQWQPLWDDLIPLAEAVATGKPTRAHFMGASVQDPVPVPSGSTETRRVIDGQQRLTTMQLLLKAFHDVAKSHGADKHAASVNKLLRNDDELIDKAEKRLKLWPTRTDQVDYQRVMDAQSPTELTHAIGGAKAQYPIKNHNIANAYLFFARELAGWVGAVEGEAEHRIASLYAALRDHLRLVVIDLDDKDDAQAIFETLNARGAPLLSADLIKNSLLAELPVAEAEEAYRLYWDEFDRDGGFWRELVGRGHAQRARIETFLQHALTLMSGEIVSAGHLYNAYDAYAASKDAGSVVDRLQRFRRLGDIYMRLHQAQDDRRLEDFYYRLQILDVVTAWPFILAVYERYGNEPATVRTILIDLESYLVRRMVCRLSSRGYGTVFASLTKLVSEGATDVVGIVRAALLANEAEADRWPTDEAFKDAWCRFPLYENLTRPRIRFLLEAMEEATRTGFAEEGKAPRGMTIEHVMPQGWRNNWPLAEGQDASARDRIVQTIGNLTLLNGKFNPYQSDRPWIDSVVPEGGKRKNLEAHTVLFLNKALCQYSSWGEEQIAARAEALFELALEIWPRPTAGQ